MAGPRCWVKGKVCPRRRLEIGDQREAWNHHKPSSSWSLFAGSSSRVFANHPWGLSWSVIMSQLCGSSFYLEKLQIPMEFLTPCDPRWERPNCFIGCVWPQVFVVLSIQYQLIVYWIWYCGPFESWFIVVHFTTLKNSRAMWRLSTSVSWFVLHLAWRPND